MSINNFPLECHMETLLSLNFLSPVIFSMCCYVVIWSSLLGWSPEFIMALIPQSTKMNSMRIMLVSWVDTTIIGIMELFLLWISTLLGKNCLRAAKLLSHECFRPANNGYCGMICFLSWHLVAFSSTFFLFSCFWAFVLTQGNQSHQKCQEHRWFFASPHEYPFSQAILLRFDWFLHFCSQLYSFWPPFQVFSQSENFLSDEIEDRKRTHHLPLLQFSFLWNFDWCLSPFSCFFPMD